MSQTLAGESPVAGGASSPVVTVVMPVYNLVAYVAQSIASVQAQTFTSWELIVIDDGSTDGTAGLVQVLAAGDQRIRFTSQTNSGAANARNHGLALMRGGYLAFLDGDDLWREDFLARAVAMLEQTQADAFSCGLEYLNPHKDSLSLPMKVPPGISDPKDLIELFLVGSVLLCMGNLVLRVTPFVRGLRFTEGCRFAEDTEYNYRALSMACSVCFLEEVLFFYRIRPGSTTQQPWDWRIRLDSIKALDRVFNHLMAQSWTGRRARLQNEFLRFQFTKYRFLYRMVKLGASSEARNLLASKGWREALLSVAEWERFKHRCKARILLDQNHLVWRLIAFYSRCKPRPWAWGRARLAQMMDILGHGKASSTDFSRRDLT